MSWPFTGIVAGAAFLFAITLIVARLWWLDQRDGP